MAGKFIKVHECELADAKSELLEWGYRKGHSTEKLCYLLGEAYRWLKESCNIESFERPKVTNKDLN